MKLTEIQELWKKDCEIDRADLGGASVGVPRLHAKYLAILTNTRLSVRKNEADYLRLRRLKYRYYRGELSVQELRELGWDQYLLNKPLKNELEEFIESDEDIIQIKDKIEYLKTVLYQLEQIIRSINSRTWDVKTAMEWTRFVGGGY